MRKNRNRVEFQDRIHRNCIRFSPAESKEHFLTKCEKCYHLRRLGLNFITEARLPEEKRRVDIFILETGDKIEIETGKSYDKKDGIKVEV